MKIRKKKNSFDKNVEKVLQIGKNLIVFKNKFQVFQSLNWKPFRHSHTRLIIYS